MSEILNRDRKVVTTTNEKDETCSTSSSALTLWEKALRRIEDSEEDEKVIANIKNFEHEVGKESPQGGVKASAKDIAQHLRKAISNRTAEGEENQWNIKFNGKEYSVRELFRNVFTILKYAVPIGDTLVSIDPVHAALPWAAVRLVMMMLDAKNKLESDMAICIAQVTKLAFQCDTYQRLYNHSNISPQQYQKELSQLEDAIVQAYVKLLLFLGFAAHQLQGERGFLAIWKLDTVESHIQNLLSVEKALAEAADYCEKCRSNQSQTTGEEILQLARSSYKGVEDQRQILLKIQESGFISKLHRVEAAEFKAYHVINEPRCHKETRIELLQEIRNWIDNPQGETIFWLEGMAGTGKSTISRTVCQMFQGTGELGASFFFKRGHGDRDKPVYFFQTIAAQLCFNLPQFAQKLMDNVNENNVSESVVDQFRELIKQPLLSLRREVEGRSTIVVVVDALDECDEEYNAVTTIVDLLSEMKSLRSTFDFRFFLTSRSECYDQYTLLTEETDRRDVALHEIATLVVETDISAYLASELETIAARYNKIATRQKSDLLEDWPSKNDLEQLVRMATPLFIFAATVCRLLEDVELYRPDRELTNILKQPTATSNEKLSATYIPVLGRLVINKDGYQRRRIEERFQKIVGSIVFLEKPLPLASLARLLQVQEDEVRGIVNSLRSVIKVPSEPSSPISTFHLSFPEFLVTKNGGVQEGFYIETKAKSEILANRCLDLLTKKDILKDDMCGLKMFGKERKDLSEKTVEQALPLEVQYACLYWIRHLRKSNIRIDDGHRVYELLREHFLHWVEALTLMGRISELIQLIQELQMMVDGTSGVEVLKFLRDAERFVLRLRTAIDVAPLQIYSPALLFAPQQSIVRKTFEDRHLGWAIQHPMVEHDWDPCLQTLEGHDGKVNCVAFSSDGTLIASGSDDRTIEVWKTTTGELQYTLEDHKGNVLCVVFSGDGELIASGSDDGTLKIWDTMTGQLQRTLGDHDKESRPQSVVFSSDDNLVASVLDKHTIKVWNTKTWEPHSYSIEGHVGDIHCVASSSDKLLFVSVSDDRKITVRDVATKKICYTLERYQDGDQIEIKDVAFSSDGKRIAVVDFYAKTIKVWETGSGALQQTIDCDRSPYSTAFLGHGNLIASGFWNGRLVIWDATNGAVHQTFRGHVFAIWSISFSPKFNLIASASDDNTIKLWDITKETMQQTPEWHTKSVTSIAFSANGQLMASSSFDKTVKIWDAMEGKLQHTLEGHTDWVSSVVFSADSKLLAPGSKDYTVKIWDAVEGTLQHTLEGHTGDVQSVVFSADSKLLASGSDDNKVKIWDAIQGTLQHTLEGHTNWIRSVVFSADSKLLASALNDFTVKIWDAIQGTLQHTLKGYIGEVESVVFSADSKLLASASSYGNKVKIWDTTQGTVCQTIYIKTRLQSVSFSPTGSHLVVEPGALQIEIADNILSTAISPWTGDETWSQSRMEPSPSHNFSLDESSSWIQLEGQNLLWIPSEYRPGYRGWGVHPTKKRIGLGAHSGRVIIIGLKDDIANHSYF